MRWKTLTCDQYALSLWQNYVSNLLNEMYPFDTEDIPQWLAHWRNLLSMKWCWTKNKKSPGPTGLTSDMMKLAGIVDLLDFLKSLKKSGTLVKNPPTGAKVTLLLFTKKKVIR